MEHWITFMRGQKLMIVACHNKEEIWVVNVYAATDEKGHVYFISPSDKKHSKMILENPHVSFSMAWFNPANHSDRKAVQGQGICRPAESKKEILEGIKCLYKNFPDMKDMLTLKWIMTNVWGSKIWVVKPSYVKYWDDELLGEEKTQEFNIF